MRVLDIFRSFKTQENALEYLEAVRWRGSPVCPYCKAETVCRHTSADRANRRWQCWSCNRAFAVTVGTIFHGTHIPLQNWFLVLALMLNAKKSASACQIARDLGMRRPTVWSMMHRIRMTMAQDPDQSRLLYGIVEADECCIRGKPHKGNNGNYPDPPNRGRGTPKQAVMGLAERNGQHHFSINHRGCYVDGIVHSNMTEFCRSVKRAWYGTHRHYSRKCIPPYLAEFCYKYNHRKNGVVFSETVSAMMAVAR